jgi:hypothetical protein
MPSPPRRGKGDRYSSGFTIALRHAAVLLCLTPLLVTLAGVTSVAADKSVFSAAAKANGTDATSGSYASQIIFSPSVITLNNPTLDYRAVSSSATPVTVTMTVYDSEGKVVKPSESNPLYINVYGAPNGVITPTQVTLTSGTSATFNYNGEAFPNNIELAAWMNDPQSGGASLGTTLLIHANRQPCSYGTASFNLDVKSNVPNEIKMRAVVGSDNPQQSQLKTFTLDTGSLGVMVTKSSLVMGSTVHGPGARGQKFYDSSGFVFTGNYYLAPVSVELEDGTFVQSNPILVLAIDGVHCQTGYKKCVQPGAPDLHYLGVGFDRNSSGTGDLFNSPSENVFLEMTDAQNGTDINGGYVLSASGVKLGVTETDASGFDTVSLTPNSSVPGDWNPVPGCYQFTTLSGSPQFCGNLLLDVGISEMFIDLPFGQRPLGSYDANNRVPGGVGMQIQAGAMNQPAMSYSFTAVQPPQGPTGPAPTYTQWVNVPSVFINTGRRPLLAFDYYYSGQCGQVGFKPN